ncbi:hypothetical protein HD806DRAFT_527706 [Xylariaceae sp. AK1471]|nr:hypothetical protein HD806DRAFT_527706 [Xylariaceae sp. AK1471]
MIFYDGLSSALLSNSSTMPTTGSVVLTLLLLLDNINSMSPLPMIAVINATIDGMPKDMSTPAPRPDRARTTSSWSSPSLAQFEQYSLKLDFCRSSECVFIKDVIER